METAMAMAMAKAGKRSCFGARKTDWNYATPALPAMSPGESNTTLGGRDL